MFIFACKDCTRRSPTTKTRWEVGRSMKICQTFFFFSCWQNPASGRSESEERYTYYLFGCPAIYLYTFREDTASALGYGVSAKYDQSAIDELPVCEEIKECKQLFNGSDCAHIGSLQKVSFQLEGYLESKGGGLEVQYQWKPCFLASLISFDNLVFQKKKTSCSM